MSSEVAQPLHQAAGFRWERRALRAPTGEL